MSVTTRPIADAKREAAIDHVLAATLEFAAATGLDARTAR